MILRPYQRGFLSRLFDAISRGQDRGLLCQPCGTGKTLSFASASRLLNVPTLVLCPTDDIVKQTVSTFNRVAPWLTTGVVKAERDEWDADVVVASVPSLSAERLGRIDRKRFPLVVADEAHLAVADTWVRAMDWFKSDFRLGCTATPVRLDGRGLAEWFGPEPLFNLPLRKAMEDGWLVRVVQYAIRTHVDLTGVDRRGGDFLLEQLAAAVNTPARNHAIVEAWKHRAADRKTLAFCVNVQHAIDLAAAFRQQGVAAEHIDGGMSPTERQAVLSRHRRGETHVLTNCQIAVVGYDDPSIRCVLMARPTESWALFVQAVGRGFRLHPGKTDCMILDAVDVSGRHRLITAFDLLGRSKKDDAQGGDILDAIKAEEVEEAKRQQEVRKQKESTPLKWRLETVCPWPTIPTLDGYRSKGKWQDEPASDKQMKYLRGFGVDIRGQLTKGQVSYLIDQAKAYDEAFPQLATAKQEFTLRLHGLFFEGMTKREAGIAMAKLYGETTRKPDAPKPKPKVSRRMSRAESGALSFLQQFMLEPIDADNVVEVKKAYRVAALKLHPDRGGDAEDFKQLQRMKDILNIV